MPIINTTLALDALPPSPTSKSGWPWTEASQPLPERMPNGDEWPRIGIVTPSYNQGQFIEETIRSVLLQGYPNLEYIIIDGGSNDNSIEIIKKYEKHFSYWVSEPDKGPTDAINKGWQITSGEIVTYLNSDDAYLPGALASVAAAFQQDQEAKAICGNELKINKEGFVIGESKVKNVDRLSLLNLNFISQPATFIKRTTLDLTGGIDLSVKYIFDFELWLRIARLSPIECIPNVLAVTRWHTETITLTRRSEIGSELVRAIDNEIAAYPSDLSCYEIQQILLKANHLAISLHLEENKVISSLKYALAALWLSSNLNSLIDLIKPYYRLMGKFFDLRKKQKFSLSKSAGIHWSSMTKKI